MEGIPDNIDPVVVEPTTGGLSIVVGLNPLPGYKCISQTVSKILVDSDGGKVYILDASAGIIGAYNANTLVRERDYALDAVPLSIAFNQDKTGILLGYSTGSIYEMDIATGGISLIGDVLMQAKLMVAFGDKYGARSTSGCNLIRRR